MGRSNQSNQLKGQKMKKLNIRPSKPASIGALIGILFMLIFGIGFAIVVGTEIVGNEAEPALSVVFILFMIAWVGTALFMLVYHFLNLKRAKGLSLVDIEAEPGSQANETVSDPIQKLRSLEALKKDGLISEDEFRRSAKRSCSKSGNIQARSQDFARLQLCWSKTVHGFVPPIPPDYRPHVAEGVCLDSLP
jgi:hypothetical protein